MLQEFLLKLNWTCINNKGESKHVFFNDDEEMSRKK